MSKKSLADIAKEMAGIDIAILSSTPKTVKSPIGP
jgi:hypothetical protein